MENSHQTVYLLGAGASREETKHLPLPLPLATDFFKPSYLKLYPTPSSQMPQGNYFHLKQSPLCKLLKLYFDVTIPPRKNESNPSCAINVEEVLSFFASINSGQPTILYDRTEHQESYNNLLQYVKHVINHISWYPALLSNEDTFYHRLCGQLNDRDSIITLNWDCLMDRALYDVNPYFLENMSGLINPIDFPGFPESPSGRRSTVLQSKQRHQYLKLHGSTNWLSCKNSDCRRHTYPILGTFTDSESDSFDRCDCCGNILEWVMMPPTYYKSYLHSRIFTLQFNLAYDLLTYASKVVIIGFSFSETDSRTRQLLRATRQRSLEMSFPKEIVIIDPQSTNSSFRRNIINLFAGISPAGRKINPQVKFCWHQSVESYNSDLIPTKPISKELAKRLAFVAKYIN